MEKREKRERERVKHGQVHDLYGVWWSSGGHLREWLTAVLYISGFAD